MLAPFDLAAVQGTINDREVQASRAVMLERELRALQKRLLGAEKVAAEYQRKVGTTTP